MHFVNRPPCVRLALAMTSLDLVVSIHCCDPSVSEADEAHRMMRRRKVKEVMAISLTAQWRKCNDFKGCGALHTDIA